MHTHTRTHVEQPLKEQMRNIVEDAKNLMRMRIANEFGGIKKKKSLKGVLKSQWFVIELCPCIN